MILSEILSLGYPILAKLREPLLEYNEQFLVWKKKKFIIHMFCEMKTIINIHTKAILTSYISLVLFLVCLLDP